MTDEEWEKTQNWLKTGAKAAPPKPPAPTPAADPPSGDTWTHTAERLGGATAATIEGMGKGIANVSGNLPTLIGLPALHSKWASSSNPDYPIAEGAGKYAPTLAALAAMPNLGMEKAATELIPELSKVPKVASVIGKGAEGLWKGYVGGGTQGSPGTGEAFGGGSAAAYATLKAMPGKQYLIPAAILAATEASRRGYMPWDIRHILSYMAEAAAAVSGKVPGVSGALGAKAVGGGDGE